MDEIKKSILDTINERISSPLIGGFIISWILWNYKTIFVLLSTKNVEDKFSYIDYVLYHDWLHFTFQGLILPLLTSIVFIFIFPYPEKWIYTFWYGHKKKLNDDKQKIDDKKLLSEEESRDIRRKHLKLEIEFNKEIDEKDTEIKHLKEIIAENEKNSVENKTVEEDMELAKKKYRIEQEARESVEEDDRNAEVERHFEEEEKINSNEQKNEVNKFTEKENNLKIIFNINNDELSILRIIYDEGIQNIDSTMLVNKAIVKLKWNKYKAEKIIKDFIGNQLIFLKSKMYNGYYDLTEDCIEELIKTYE
ncbi:MAG: hypothetical protein WC667_13120 [Sulfurimonas sp.]|jgi:hypothetical protein